MWDGTISVWCLIPSGSSITRVLGFTSLPHRVLVSQKALWTQQLSTHAVTVVTPSPTTCMHFSLIPNHLQLQQTSSGVKFRHLMSLNHRLWAAVEKADTSKLIQFLE